MKRILKRIANRLEKNPIAECAKIVKKYIPNLNRFLSETKDPRDVRYITYTNRTLLGQMVYKGISSIVSMQEMTRQFNNDEAVSNIYSLINEEAKEMLPHYVTSNEYLERLDPEEIRKILHRIVYDCIRRKTFDDARYKKRWIIIIDGTQKYSGERKINDKCLERHHDKGTENESISYHEDVLEAKIYLGERLLLSIGSEFIENDPENGVKYADMTDEKAKQDCEKKAFKRLAEKLHKEYPRLPMVLLMDSLFASETVITKCGDYGWKYIIRYKEGSIPTIAQEFKAIPDKNVSGHATYVNEIDYRGLKINMLKTYENRKIKKDVEKRIEFSFLTNIELTDKNVGKVAMIGRRRWKIENEGFNRQKNWSGDITHACSWDSNALKNHYLIYQISDFIRQLYEWFYLKKNGIEKTHKKISSDLLYALTKQEAKREDIYTVEGIAFC